jgi:lysophospholipase L1-like esterase
MTVNPPPPTPAPRSRAKTFVFVCALAVLGSMGLLLAAEIVVRIKYSLDHKDAGYMVLGILAERRRGIPRDMGIEIATPAAPAKPAPVPAAPASAAQATPKASGVPPATPPMPAAGAGAAPPVAAPIESPFSKPPAIAIPNDHLSRQWNECSQRDIDYRVNTAGGRGPEWPEQKSAAAIRILAIGESSTYGAANPEDFTWPVLLEKTLKAQYGLNVEVLNFGVPGQRIKGLLQYVPAVLDKYQPDVVVHYGGYNESWAAPEIPTFLRFLHYRSMLYTYIEEKAYFRAEASTKRLVPDTRTYEQAFRRLLGVVRASGARVVVVSQAQPMGATPREGTGCAQNWRDDKSLAGCLENLIEQPDRYTRLVRSRLFKTVVLQQVLADVAAQEKLLVIDPRPALVERDDSKRLFCDEIHLTDHGNAVLAGLIAQPLAEYLRAQSLPKTGS